MVVFVADGELRVRSLARRDAWAPMFGEPIPAVYSRTSVINCQKFQCQ